MKWNEMKSGKTEQNRIKWNEMTEKSWQNWTQKESNPHIQSLITGCPVI
jgi:hypothetical protein